MTKLVFIGGYGKSGTTLLEILMAGSPAVIACGEVLSITRRKKDKGCTCGRPRNECPVWSFLYDRNPAPIWTHVGLLQELIQRVGRQYSAIIDSSKTAWGSASSPFRLRRRFGPDFVLVHITRQPTAACWSVIKRKEKTAKQEGRRLLPYPLRCGWTVLHWSFANLSCELFGLLYPRQYLRLRYEDLVRSPAAEVRALFARFFPEINWSFVEPSARDNRHQRYGNSIRRRPLTIADVKEDLRWKAETPPEYSRVVLALSYPLRRRYGY